jgi:hypothetical protein
MKRLSALSVAACVLLGVLAAYGQTGKQRPSAERPAATRQTILAAAPAAKPNKVSVFMQLKLEHSQKVLEGIVLEDFGMIAKHAQQLALLTQDENWEVLQTRDYRRHSDDFVRIAERLKDAAQEKNVDGAALDYVQLTLNCVDCHKHVRDQRGQ